MIRLARLTFALAAIGLTGTAARAEIIYGISTGAANGTGGANLVRFDSATPGSVTAIGAPLSTATGLVAGHSLRALDVRPATGQMYALSTAGGTANAQLYTMNLTTGVLTPVGTGFVLTGALGANTNDRMEMDFNPVADRIRIVTASTSTTVNNNFRANPNDGTLVAADTNLAFAAGDPRAGQPVQIGGAAYTNSFAGATATTLYAWDYQNDGLATIGSINGSPNSPNTGLMNTVASPGTVTTNNTIGYDISGVTGTAYVTNDANGTGQSALYTQNLTTGARTLTGNFPAGTFLLDIAVAPVPEPSTLALAGFAAAGVAGRTLRRKKIVA